MKLFSVGVLAHVNPVEGLRKSQVVATPAKEEPQHALPSGIKPVEKIAPMSEADFKERLVDSALVLEALRASLLRSVTPSERPREGTQSSAPAADHTVPASSYVFPIPNATLARATSLTRAAQSDEGGGAGGQRTGASPPSAPWDHEAAFNVPLDALYSALSAGTMLVSGTPVAIDPSRDTLRTFLAALDRIEGVETTIDANASRVTVRTQTPGALLELRDATGLLAALRFAITRSAEITPPGARGTDTSGATTSKSTVAEIVSAVRTLDRVLSDPHVPKEGITRAQALGEIRAALRALGRQLTTGITLDAEGRLRVDEGRLVQALAEAPRQVLALLSEEMAQGIYRAAQVPSHTGSHALPYAGEATYRELQVRLDTTRYGLGVNDARPPASEPRPAMDGARPTPRDGPAPERPAPPVSPERAPASAEHARHHLSEHAEKSYAAQAQSIRPPPPPDEGVPPRSVHFEA